MEKILPVLESARQRMRRLPGHLGLYYKDLTTGLTFGVGAEEEYLAASVIKLPIYLNILRLIHQGQLDPREQLKISRQEMVPGCGALSLLSGEPEVDIASACRLMICLSDNTATNALIRRVGMDQTREGLRALGLEKTVLRRLLFDSEAAARGLENTVCPRELGELLEKLHRGTFLSPERSREALQVLKGQQIRHKLRGGLAGQLEAAHKTGEDTNLSNDVGILFAPRPFILCFTGHDTEVYPWEDLIRSTALDLARLHGLPEKP